MNIKIKLAKIIDGIRHENDKRKSPARPLVKIRNPARNNKIAKHATTRTSIPNKNAEVFSPQLALSK